MHLRRIVPPLVVLGAVGLAAVAGAAIGIPSLSGAQTTSSTSTTVATKPARPFRGGTEIAAAAKALGMSTSDLLAKLSDGKTTIADVAQQHKVDLQTVVDAMSADAHAKLDDAVKNGRLTQKQADALATRIKDRVTQTVNNGFRAGHFGAGFGGYGRRGATAAAAAAAVSM